MLSIFLEYPCQKFAKYFAQKKGRGILSICLAQITNKIELDISKSRTYAIRMLTKLNAFQKCVTNE